MSLLSKIEVDLVTALKAHDSNKVATLRLVKNALANAAINQQGTLDEAQEIQVIKKQAKDRQEAIALYQQAGKTEARAKEEAELAIIKEYLPEEISDEQISQVIERVIAEINPSGPSDFGKVMGKVMGELKGQANGQRISAIIQSKLK